MDRIPVLKTNPAARERKLKVAGLFADRTEGAPAPWSGDVMAGEAALYVHDVGTMLSQPPNQPPARTTEDGRP